MSVFVLPTCPTTCAGTLGEVDFDECAPEVHYGEISIIYLWELGNALFTAATYADPTTWSAAITAGTLLEFIVIGEMPEPEQTETPISGDRIVTGFKKFVVNFEIDETNETNYKFLLLSECGGKYSANFATADGLVYGGYEGLDVSVKLNQVIPRERTGVVKIMGKMSWSSKFHPFRQTEIAS